MLVLHETAKSGIYFSTGRIAWFWVAMRWVFVCGCVGLSGMYSRVHVEKVALARY